MRVTRFSAVVMGLLAVLSLASCGTTPAPAPAPTVTVTQTPVPAATQASPSTSVSTPPATVAAVATNSASIVVPNAVGKDYQSAQDLWRAAGLHVLPAIDALGANRLPVIDSNWVVLAQDPKPGTTVPMDSFITATVKKYTDN